MKTQLQNNGQIAPKSNDEQIAPAPKKTRKNSFLRRFAAWFFGIIAAFLVIILGACIFLEYWLTPQRVARIAEYEAEKYLDADVEIADADFSIMSTFPHFKVNIDSVYIRSNSLDNLTDAQRAQLPDDPAFLASFSRLSGGINILKLMAGRIDLKDIEVSDLKVNLVALNDSLANYNIVREKSDQKVNIPRISAYSIFLIDPQRITYFSAATGSDAVLKLQEAALTRLENKKNDYNLCLSGLIDATVDSLEVLNHFPFRFDGHVAFGFKPFSVKMSDYDVDLGNTRGNLNLALELGNSLKINNLDYRLGTFDAMQLLSYLPKDILPTLEGISADLDVAAFAKLAGPYDFSAETLPSFEVTIESPSGTVDYTISGSRTYHIRNNGLRAMFSFDGNNPGASSLELPIADVSGEGISARLSGTVANLLSAPQVSAKLLADGDAKAMRKLMGNPKEVAMKGNIHLDTDLRFRMDSLTADRVRDLAISGHADVGNYRFKLIPQNIDASGRGLHLAFAATGTSVSPQNLSNVRGNIALTLPSVDYNDGERSITAKNLTINGKSAAKNVSSSATSLPPMSLSVAAQEFALQEGQTSIALGKLQAKVDARQRDKKHAVPAPMAPPADAPLLERVKHTPEYIAFVAPDELKAIFSGWDINGSVKAADGRLITPAYPVRNYISNVDLNFSLDSVALNGLQIQSQTNHAAVSARLGNLRNIILSDAPQPIPLDLVLSLDTINTNSVAGTYEAGVRLLTGKPYYSKVPHDSVPITAEDSMTMLIPRNLMAHIKADIKETVYRNLHLYDLSADVDMADGHARVSDVNIGASFGHAGLNLDYNTSDLAKLDLHLGANLDSINVVKFFDNFHALLLMMPEMHNLSGFISAEATAGFGFSPNMFMNLPSMDAAVDVQGRELCIHQDEFIRHITRMLMIHNSGDLHINDLNVHASVHDNLMELFPFDVEVENYALNVLGLNNFNGEMYYHIGVDRWPLHIPFGINIKGDFHHPEFRFGGAHYADEKAWPITSAIAGNHNINMMREMKYYMKELIHAAAEASTAPASDFAFPAASPSLAER